MANIPVEEKGGTSSWWAWLIGILVLIVIIWVLF